MKKYSKIMLAILSISIMACSSDSESDLTGDGPNPSGDITYTSNIRSVISANCLGCHTNPPVNNAPFALTTFDLVVTRAENGSLLTALSKQTGEARAMPPGGRLPQATIDLVEQWIEDGLLE